MANQASSSSSPLLSPPNPTPHYHHHSSPNSPPPELKPKFEFHTRNPRPTSTSSPSKKNPPLPWTHQETINLIQAYQEKWYSLRKGQLKASQWEEVSTAVADRCGYDEPSKSATQCRHKIEKLRKRYRAEQVRPYPSSWQYFELMDRMERGPLPIAAVRPVATSKYQNSISVGDYNESDSDDEDADYGAVDARRNKLKSINNIVRSDTRSSNNKRNLSRMMMDRNFGGGGESERIIRTLRDPMDRKRKAPLENDESDEDDESDEGQDEDEEVEEEEMEGKEKERDAGMELAAEIRGFAERFMRMENKKVEIMRETERCRMEMENKRMEMILEAQRKIVDTIGRAFGAHK